MGMNLEKDIEILKPLVEKAVELSKTIQNSIKTTRWSNVNEHIRPDSPPIYIMLDDSAWEEIIPDKDLRCESIEARNLEFHFKKSFYLFETDDDTPIYDTLYLDGIFDVTPKNTWGIDVAINKPAEKNGAWKHDYPIKDYDDFDKLVIPQYQYNKTATMEKVEKYSTLVQGKFNTAISSDLKSSALTRHVDELRGMMQIMYDIMDEPDFVHNLMDYLTKAHFSAMKAVENSNILTTGPRHPWYESNIFGPEPVKGNYSYKNRWIRMHGQEFDQVSPKACEEFLFPYQKKVAELYGRVEYGCCENLTHKIKSVMEIPNIAIVSCSPYSDLKTIAETVEDKAVLQWRQRPTDLLFSDDLSNVKKTLKEGFEILSKSHFHIALREIMTFNGKYERLKEFIEIARDYSANKL